MIRLDDTRYWDKVERAATLVDRDIKPLLPEGVSIPIGDVEWYISYALDMAETYQITMSEELLMLSTELDQRDGDVYLPAAFMNIV
ncbi:MAG: hypothetical protein ACTHW1_08655 [Ancrocorticia sp.]|uniref:hypothetical protein n=1 Tax=Ancrocorticia sp. TaxID=2593684 RepID=UPI003F90336E